jgi:hypothetical protein
MELFGLPPRVTAALIAGMMFFIISNSYFYQLVDSLVGDTLGRIASPSGCPTTWGLIVHSSVFALAHYYGLGI